MKKIETMPLGIILERREIDNPWQDHSWRAVAVMPGAAEVEDWHLLASEEGWAQYHAATLTLELHRSETESYRTNLADNPPRIFVVLREDEEAEVFEYVPFLVTASTYEAQDYLDSSEEIVDGVTMPDAVIAWVQAFIDEHHVDVPFVKRKRKPHGTGQEEFSQPPRGRVR
jgi:hypothetical protein